MIIAVIQVSYHTVMELISLTINEESLLFKKHGQSVGN